MGCPFIGLFLLTLLLLFLSIVKDQISFADGKSADEILVVVVADFQELVSLFFREDQFEDLPFNSVGLPGPDFIGVVTSDDADLEDVPG